MSFGTAWAAELGTSGSCGTSATYTVSGSTLTISGTGEISKYAFSPNDGGKDISGITSVVIESGITSIGNRAFYPGASVSSLTLLTLPATLETIGTAAFMGTAITSLAIPASVKTIKQKAFEDCTSLASVTVAENSQLETIGDSAFDNCSFTSIILPCKSLSSVGNGAFDRNKYCGPSEIICLTETSLSVDDLAFYDNKGETTVYMLGSHKVPWGSRSGPVKSLVSEVVKGEGISSLEADYTNTEKKTVNGTTYCLSGSSVGLTLSTSLTGDYAYMVNGKDELDVEDGKATLILPDDSTVVTISAVAEQLSRCRKTPSLMTARQKRLELP